MRAWSNAPLASSLPQIYKLAIRRFCCRTWFGWYCLPHCVSSLVGALTAARADGRYATIEDIGAASSILLVGNDPTHEHPLVAYQIARPFVTMKRTSTCPNSQEIKLQRQAKQTVVIKAGAEAEAIRVLAGAPGVKPPPVHSAKAWPMRSAWRCRSGCWRPISIDPTTPSWIIAPGYSSATDA